MASRSKSSWSTSSTTAVQAAASSGVASTRVTPVGQVPVVDVGIGDQHLGAELDQLVGDAAVTATRGRRRCCACRPGRAAGSAAR